MGEGVGWTRECVRCGGEREREKRVLYTQRRKRRK
jgi:hypothetical protein